MVKEKKQEETSKSNLGFFSRESSEVSTMEYIIKKYIANILTLAENDTLGNTSPLKPYVEEITQFVVSYNLARGFPILLTEESATELWKTIRSNYRDVSSFLLHVTSEYRMIYGPEEFKEVCRKIAYATGFNNDPETSIIMKSDPIFSKVLRRQDNMDKETDFLFNNPWLVTMFCISVMNPLKGD